MYGVIFSQAALTDLIEAHEWYESRVAGLGVRFRTAIEAVVSRIASSPRQFPVVHRNVRRALVRRFPYALFFVMDSEALLVIACFHCSRDPAHWQRRI